jgi:superfamily II DNA or RNA helicase
MPERWPNQVRAFDGTLAAIARGVKRLCVTSPTGSGKTQMMLDLIQWAVEYEKPVALYTQRRMLYDQTCASLDKAGIDYGRRAAGHNLDRAADVQMCMVQSEISAVYRREHRLLHHAKLVIVDEAHSFGGATFQQVIQDHVAAGATTVGYTATPLDLEGYDELLIAGTMSECLRIGALVPPKTFSPDEPDLRHIKKYVVGEDLTETENVKAIMRPGVFGRVLSKWKQHNPDGLPTLLFGPDVAGSLFFAQEFCKAGIKAAHIDGEQIWCAGEFYNTEQDARKWIAEQSKSGEVKVVCNRFVLREGIDWPWIQCGSFATVFGALTSFLQSGGRLLRAHPGKQHCIIIDHGGNWHRHSSLALDRHWELGITNHRVAAERQERLREKKEPEPIRCPQCGKVRVGGAKCPECGFEAHRQSRMVVQVDGTLREVKGDIYRPRMQKIKPNTQQQWNREYYRAKNSRRGMTFRQAEALFFRDHHYWPPRTLAFMPKNPGDWFAKVSQVPRESLI